MEALSPERWSETLRSPAEEADRQVRNFPHHALDALARAVQLDSLDTLLNLGGTVGVLASHLSALMAETSNVILAESDPNYLEADVPSSLYFEAPLERDRVDYEALPYAENAFDGLIVSDFLSMFAPEPRERILEEIGRVLSSRGVLIVLESLESTRWLPDNLEGPEEERDRLERFESLREDAHGEAETRLFAQFRELPAWLDQSGFDVGEVGGWFQPLRLNDTRWTERQRTDLINLRHQARRDQVDILRYLLNETDRWEEGHASFLREVASDCQQRALRKRKALETDEETGWTGTSMLLVRATPKTV